MVKYTPEMVEISVAIGHERLGIAESEARLQTLITQARDHAMPWSMIGTALGITAQGAWERYGLTPEEKRQRAAQRAPKTEQDAIPGLELTREERVTARKAVLKKHRGHGSEQY